MQHFPRRRTICSDLPIHHLQMSGSCSSGTELTALTAEIGKKGWWMIPPGQSKVVYAGDLAALQACCYYYAHGADGRQWSGPYTELVPSTAFDWCINTSSTDARSIGMREICTGNFNSYTLTLNPDPYRLRADGLDPVSNPTRLNIVQPRRSCQSPRNVV